MGWQSHPVPIAPWVPRALLAPLAERSAHHRPSWRRERTDESTGRMFLTRASAVATRSNRPPRAFSTAPAEPHDRPEPSATASARHFPFFTRRPTVRPLTRPSSPSYPILLLLSLFLLLLLKYFIKRWAPVRRIPATRTSPFSIRSYRAATADRRSVNGCTQTRARVCLLTSASGFACHHCCYYHHRRRHH